MTQKEVENSEKKNCQFCRETLLKDAVVCRYCGREQFSFDEMINLKHYNSFWEWSPIFIVSTVFLLFLSPAIALIFIFASIVFMYIHHKKFRLKEKHAFEENKLQDMGSLQRKNREYKLKFMVFGFIVLLMFMTNPQKKDLYEHIRAEYSILIKSIEVEIIEVKDYLILSYYSVDIGLIDKNKHYFLGILNRIFELDKKKGEEIFIPKEKSERERGNR